MYVKKDFKMQCEAQTIIESTSSDFASCCQSILKKFDGTCFQHNRVYNNMEHFWLTTRPDFTAVYFKEGMYNYALCERHPTTYRKGILLWDNWEETSDAFIKVGKPAQDEFNISHGVSIFEPSESYCDIYEIGLKRHDSNTALKLATELSYALNFIKHYKERAKGLISYADKHRYKLEYSHDKLFSPHKHNVILELECRNNGQLVSFERLTVREYECLAWLTRGKTIPEIALILGISKRTVEKFIANIKSKLECYTLFQIGRFVGKHNKYFNKIFECIK